MVRPPGRSRWSARDQSLEIRRHERLAQVVGGPGGAPPLLVLRSALGGHQHDRHLRMEPLRRAALQKLEAVHFGHVEVEQDQRDLGMRREQAVPFPAVDRGADGIPASEPRENARRYIW